MQFTNITKNMRKSINIESMYMEIIRIDDQLRQIDQDLLTTDIRTDKFDRLKSQQRALKVKRMAVSTRLQNYKTGRFLNSN